MLVVLGFLGVEGLHQNLLELLDGHGVLKHFGDRDAEALGGVVDADSEVLGGGVGFGGDALIWGWLVGVLVELDDALRDWRVIFGLFGDYPVVWWVSGPGR